MLYILRHKKNTPIVVPHFLTRFLILLTEGTRLIVNICNLTNSKTYSGFIRKKSVIEDNIAKRFPEVRFIESDPELDHAGDIDYLGWVGGKAFGIQIKPFITRVDIGNYSPSERMQASFDNFKKKYKGNVFIVFSIDDTIKNKEVIEQIAEEISRLRK